MERKFYCLDFLTYFKNWEHRFLSTVFHLKCACSFPTVFKLENMLITHAVIPSVRKSIVRTGRSSISLPMRQHLMEQWIGTFLGEDIVSSRFIILPHKFVRNCAHSKLEYWNCSDSFITLFICLLSNAPFMLKIINYEIA